MIYLRIESDGSPVGTRVFTSDGQEVAVTTAEVRHEVGDLPRLVIETIDFEMKMNGRFVQDRLIEVSPGQMPDNPILPVDCADDGSTCICGGYHYWRSLP